MASEEHLNLANFVKSVHQKLRDESKILGNKEAWQKHCENEENLRKYASAMQSLASNHWEVSYKQNAKATSRVEWVYNFCKSYFTEENLIKHREKEREIAHKMNMDLETVNLINIKEKLKLLDVGSCYNPFKQYSCFDVLPIDLAPATSDVHKCDFLNLQLGEDQCIVENSEITALQTESFHVVVFSLLLEYFPSPSQRLLCCQKAYSLLLTEGILIIITPDSKHVGANSKIMKTWRFILSKYGFSRIKYEKLSYLHCMVFRKSLIAEVSQRWASLQDEQHFYDDFVIPQDFKKGSSVSNLNRNISCDTELFRVLPYSTEELE